MIFSILSPRNLKNLCTLRFRSRMKMLHLSAAGCFSISPFKLSRQANAVQFIFLQILLTQIRKMVILSPSNEYCRNPTSTRILNLVCNEIFIATRFLPHCPEQQMGTLRRGPAMRSTDKSQNMPESRVILPEMKSRPPVSSSFLMSRNSGSAFRTQLASLSFETISRNFSYTASRVSICFSRIFSCSGKCATSPISFYSCFIGTSSFRVPSTGAYTLRCPFDGSALRTPLGGSYFPPALLRGLLMGLLAGLRFRALGELLSLDLLPTLGCEAFRLIFLLL